MSIWTATSPTYIWNTAARNLSFAGRWHKHAGAMLRPPEGKYKKCRRGRPPPWQRNTLKAAKAFVLRQAKERAIQWACDRIFFLPRAIVVYCGQKPPAVAEAPKTFLSVGGRAERPRGKGSNRRKTSVGDFMGFSQVFSLDKEEGGAVPIEPRNREAQRLLTAGIRIVRGERRAPRGGCRLFPIPFWRFV